MSAPTCPCLDRSSSCRRRATGPSAALGGGARAAPRRRTAAGASASRTWAKPARSSRATPSSRRRSSRCPPPTSRRSRDIDGVESAAGGLTLNSLHIEGTVPEQTQQPGQFGSPGRRRWARPRQHRRVLVSVSGVDQTSEGARRCHVGPDHLGTLLRSRCGAPGDPQRELREPVRSLRSETRVKLAGKKLHRRSDSRRRRSAVSRRTSTSSSPSSRSLSATGRVESTRLRARRQLRATCRRCRPRLSSSGQRRFRHDRVRSRRTRLRHARGRQESRGQARRALSIVALLSAFLIATLLTLSSVSKRIRELGTLKALGWSQWLVVRQVTGRVALPGTARRSGRRLSRARRERQRSPLWRRHSRRRSRTARPVASDLFLGRSDRARLRHTTTECRARCTGEPDARRGGGRPGRTRRTPRGSRRKPSRGATAPRRCPTSHRLRETT